MPAFNSKMKDEMHVGYICVLKKDGSEATKVPLGESNCTFGSAMDSTVRLKMDNPFLRNVHCEIEVQNDGIVSIHLYQLYEIFNYILLSGGFNK